MYMGWLAYMWGAALSISSVQIVERTRNNWAPAVHLHTVVVVQHHLVLCILHWIPAAILAASLVLFLSAQAAARGEWGRTRIPFAIVGLIHVIATLIHLVVIVVDRVLSYPDWSRLLSTWLFEMVEGRMWGIGIVLDTYRQVIDAMVYNEGSNNDDRLESSLAKAKQWRCRTFQ